MFFRILLGSFCLHLVTSIPADVQVANSTEDVDNFIIYVATPVKDEFDWKLLQKYTSAKGYKNVILSPISLKLVLALLYEGATGVTEKEFQNVLKFPADKGQLRRNFSELLDTLIVNRHNYIINIGTRLFLDSHLHVEQTFEAKADTFYHAEVASTNFSHPREASTNINEWVETLTNGRIKSIVTPGDIENAVLLVANAIYFKGLWSLPFLKNETFTGGFHTSSTKSVPVSYMTVTEKFFHFSSKSLDAEVLRLPYKGKKFALYIILPYSKDGLAHLIDNLNFDDLTRSVRYMEERPVKVILPKFRYDFQAKYSEVLREFGFDTLFRGIASFTGIVRDQEAQLIVTDILQKSGIDINEEGSIVHTTTQVIIGNKFRDEDVITFNASRPFLFYIQEEVTHNILFIGKIENPLEQDSNTDASNLHDNSQAEAAQTVSISDQTTIYQPPAPVQPKFNLELLKNAIGTSKNVFISPASIKVSLAMLAQAGGGLTSEEIYSALQIPLKMRNQVVLQHLVGELSASYPHSTLEFQNALFVSDKERVKVQYQNIVEQYYRALLRKINYNNAEYAASEINSFIKNATRGFIQAVLSPDDIDPNTKIILANALYFKATWLKRFDTTLTKPGCFHATREDCITVPFMHIIDVFFYGETVNSYIVQLNYTGNHRAMLLVIPKHKDGLLAALRDIEAFRSFSELIESLNQTEVELILPKFEINYYSNLVGTLEKLGIRKVFSSDSNLHIFESNESELVDRFIHKAKIEVTEDGTEASAVSLVPVIPLMGTSTPKVNADHPFAFFIFNTQTKTVLFEGILNEPEQSAVSASNTRNHYVFPETIPDNKLFVLPLQTERQPYRYNF